MSIELGATWRVTAAMQDDFVAMSGDANPLHTDAVAARRLPFGRVAVHGLHLVLDSLERIAIATDRQPAHVAATFRHSVGIDDELSTALAVDEESVVRATVTTDAWVAAEATVRLGEFSSYEMPHSRPPHLPPERLGARELPGRSGAIAIAADVSLARLRFPTLSASVGLTCVSELLSLTRLVGMHVPGERSLFSSFEVALTGGSGRDGLAYEVDRFDDRFGLATIRIDGPNVVGTLRAFLRAEPVEPDLGPTRPEPGEFTGQRWVVVGGSRGLGAIAVLLLDAGGADVRFTYRDGADDAERLETQTTSASAHRFDVLAPGSDLDAVTEGGWRPTHLAYFASPPIFDGVQGAYSPALEQRFRAVYIDAFERLVAELVDLGDLEGVLWPSSAAVGAETPGLAEYATVKRAGERRCRQLAERSDLTVHAPRFPRLRTDQTASIVPVEYGDAPTELLTALRGAAGDASD